MDILSYETEAIKLKALIDVLMSICADPERHSQIGMVLSDYFGDLSRSRYSQKAVGKALSLLRDAQVMFPFDENAEDTLSPSPDFCQSFITKFLFEVLDISEISPGIYLSSRWGGSNERALEFLGIGHVVRILDDVHFTNRVQYQRITSTDVEAPDRDPESVAKIFPTGIESAQAALTDGMKVLVHCQMGISRSASVIVGLTMRRLSMDYEEARALVHHRRPVICIHEVFERYLKE